MFSSAGADLDGPLPLVGSCGSGLTACVLALAAHHSTGKLVSSYGVTVLTPSSDAIQQATMHLCMPTDCRLRWLMDGVGQQGGHSYLHGWQLTSSFMTAGELGSSGHEKQRQCHNVQPRVVPLMLSHNGVRPSRPPPLLTQPGMFHLHRDM